MGEPVPEESVPISEESVTVSDYIAEYLSPFTSPLNVCLIIVISYCLYLLYNSKKRSANEPVREPVLPPLRKQDMTPEQLRQYDGQGPDGRVCLSINGKVFDVTKGKRFYGPGAPYEAFAGRDATRGLATFSVQVTTEDYDDLSDLNSMQMESVKEWEMQFYERYHYVGRLLKRGEEPTDYSEEEEVTTDKEEATTDKEEATTDKEEVTTDKEEATTDKEEATADKDSKKTD